MRKRIIVFAVLLAAVCAYVVSLVLPSAERFITNPGPLAYLVYVLVIITEVIVAPIPGGILALVGAANFGFFPAWILNYVANVIGANIAFVLARVFGKPFVDRVVSEDTQQKYNSVVEGHLGFAFFAYAFPFFPIDVLSFSYGLSSLDHKKFFGFSTAGLIINSAAYAYLGSRFGARVPYLQEISVTIFISVLLLVGYWLYSEYSQTQ